MSQMSLSGQGSATQSLRLSPTQRSKGQRLLTGLQVQGIEMKNFIAALFAAAMLTFGFSAPSQAGVVNLPKLETLDLKSKGATVHKVGRRRFRRGAAIALGILGAAAIIGAARAHDRGYRRYRRRGRSKCRRWLRRCEDYGNRRACYKFDRYC